MPEWDALVSTLCQPARRTSWRTALAVAIFVVTLWPAGADGSERVLASKGDASVVNDLAADTWTISSAGIALTLGMDANQQLVVRRIFNPQTRRILTDASAPDTVLNLNGQSLALAEGATGFHFDGAAAETWHGGVHLAFTYSHRALQASVVRHYASYPGSPTIEVWTVVQVSAGGDPVISSHWVGWQLAVPAGTVRWINGLRGDASDTPADEAFSLVRQDLAPGESVTLQAYRRSSERFMPFVMVDNGADEWFGGVQWSGAWRITCARGSAMQITLEYPGTTTTVTDAAPLEMPHSFFGISVGGPTTVGAALRGFLATGVRGDRPIRPLVTYNTWYPYGTRIDEPTMLDEIDRTASAGMELFVLDAGWYQGAGALGVFDFDTGLGTWAADSERFPNGLRPLADRAHARGMKFGLWVEPGRVSLDTVGVDGLARAEWLAQYNGHNVTPTSGQLCYGNRATRQWIQHQLYALIDEVQPDYLKWDNNAWANCNRSGHDHGAGDGNFAQVQGLYALWQDLRTRYPNLLIENVADGGSRIDFGALRYSDSAWMDDRTSPATRVRHNIEGISALFPPGYLLSFVIDEQTAPLAQSPDPIAEFRSRMLGVLGFGYRSPGLLPRVADEIGQAIQEYGQFRDILQDADALLLSDQAPSAIPGWDAVEHLKAATGEAVLFAFQQLDANDRVTLRPIGLMADATYAVQSLDAGDLGNAIGADLMRDGIEIVQGNGTQAHVLILRVR